MMPLHDIFGKMGSLGMLGLEYSSEYGGGDADHLFTVVLAEEFGKAAHGSIGMALGVQTDMATPSLHRFGTEELEQKYLAPAIRGEMVASIAVTEPDAGSDVAAIRTKAVQDGDEWVINGSKMYITNSLQADWLCLLARTSDEGGYAGMSQIVVPTDSPGFEVSKKLDKLGMRASDTGLLSFTDMRVPVANTIGTIGAGFQQQMAQFVDRADVGDVLGGGRVREGAPPHRVTICGSVMPSASPCSRTSTSSTGWPSWPPRSTCSSTTTTRSPPSMCAART